MKNLLSAAIITILLSQALYAEGVKDIISRHSEAQISAINDYLKQNPQAKDQHLAYKSLSSLYKTQGHTEKGLESLDMVYKLTKGTKHFQPQPVFMNIMQPYLAICSEGGLTDKAVAKLKQFEQDFSSHPEAQMIKGLVTQLIGELQMPAIGGTMDIAFTSINGGEKIDLSELKGKVVLVDFWATWCGPCVAEIPHVKKTYEAYHDKGFEVIAISLDRDEKALINYITDNNLPWPQCLDKKEEASFADKYGISSIPATFLINQEGKIVATGLRGSQLENKVAELLSE